MKYTKLNAHFQQDSCLFEHRPVQTLTIIYMNYCRIARKKFCVTFTDSETQIYGVLYVYLKDVDAVKIVWVCVPLIIPLLLEFDRMNCLVVFPLDLYYVASYHKNIVKYLFDLLNRKLTITLTF